eukprot:Nitzschia sp. Nitz4//scaffold166_size90379//49372//50115//NITZ4_005061-RA/size90379-augustus-gene-0.13-mRNA-1//-1//CDS//3329538208//7914//frame0
MLSSVLRSSVARNAGAMAQRRFPVAFFSSDSHDDFAPQRKKVEQDDALELVKDLVATHPVLLYMKGNPSMPMCGFSARAVQALQAEGVDFSSVNVLDYPDVREAVKQFADWPTIPQLYVNGEFIGGCDIVVQMHESGELKDLLSEAKKEDKKSLFPPCNPVRAASPAAYNSYSRKVVFLQVSLVK